MADSDESKVPKSKISTRVDDKVWFIGYISPSFQENTLPTKENVLCRLYFDLRKKKSSLSTASNVVADELLDLWKKAGIPTTQKPNVVSKIKNIHETHRALVKHRTRTSAKQTKQQNEFTESISRLFDIAHQNAGSLIKIEEDRTFLQDQRTVRKMIIGAEDTEYHSRAAKLLKRKQNEIDREERERKRRQIFDASMIDQREDADLKESVSDEDEEVQSGNEDSDDFCLPKHACKPSTAGCDDSDNNAVSEVKTKKRALLDDPVFIASLDRTRTTPRQAMHIVAPALKAAGVNLDEVSLSTTSIYRSRKEVRKQIAGEIKENFSPNTPLVAHFDGKLMPDETGVSSDRLPVVVSGVDTEKLLGIPKLPSGTGAIMGKAVVEFVQDWPGVVDCLAGLCFDTTSSNTGCHSGAITVIQEAFQKRLLFLACRHHILEIIAAAVFDQFFTASGPQIAIFSRFKEKWRELDHSRYSSFNNDESLTEAEQVWLNNMKSDAIVFLKHFLENQTVTRQDYTEFAQLCLLILDETTATTFSPPGAYHRARWMAKGIYSIKIYLFREQFKLTKHEKQSLRRVCLFTATIYIKAWLSAPISEDAPVNDLVMLQRLEEYAETDSSTAHIALQKLKNHLWYLSEDLVVMCLFSDKISPDQKKEITQAMQKRPKKKDSRRFEGKTTSFKDHQLKDFATSRSMNFFTSLNINARFLQQDPASWPEDAEYCKGKKKVSALRVINDCAERAVKLASDYNLLLTKDEEQKQLIFQIVEKSRKDFETTPSKSSFL